jgi:hypothetical protein
VWCDDNRCVVQFYVTYLEILKFENLIPPYRKFNYESNERKFILNEAVQIKLRIFEISRELVARTKTEQIDRLRMLVSVQLSKWVQPSDWM